MSLQKRGIMASGQGLWSSNGKRRTRPWKSAGSYLRNSNASVTTAAINSSSTYTHTCANAAHHPRRSTHSRSEHKLYSRKALGCRSWKNRCTCCSGFRYMASAPADGNPIARTCVTPAHRA